MIIPIIFSLNPVANDRMYTWVFIKAVSFAKRYHWPVIAQKQYFDNIDNLEGFFSENLLEHFEYEPIDKRDLVKIIPIEFPKELETEYINKYPSQTDAYLASLRTPWKEMEQFLNQEIDKVETVSGEKVEAFYILPNSNFIDNVAARRNIPVIHFEWGPFRPRAYRKTAYFDFDNIVLGLRKRYDEFIKQQENTKVPMFTRQEILALFLEKDYLHYAVEKTEPSYEVGVATGYSTIGEYSAYNMVSLIELQNKISKKFKEDEVCWRMHPEDPQHAQLPVKNKSCHENTVEFILDCKRIVSMNSNMIYEAMVWDRFGYDIGFSHYSFQGNDTLDSIDDKAPDIQFLNFVAFAYLIPYEFLNSLEYIRFRLSKPSEEEIYKYHLNYYLNVYNLKKEIIDRKDRLQIIIQSRKVETCEDQFMTDNIWFKTSGEVYSNVQLLRLKRKVENIEKEKNMLQNKVDELLHKVEADMQIAILYLDKGAGFTENDKLFARYEIINGKFTAKFKIPDDVRAIRFDPCECGEKALYFENLKINGKENCYDSFNIQKVAGKNTFIMKNPYFVLKEFGKQIVVQLEVYSL